MLNVDFKGEHIVGQVLQRCALLPCKRRPTRTLANGSPTPSMTTPPLSVPRSGLITKGHFLRLLTNAQLGSGLVFSTFLVCHLLPPALIAITGEERAGSSFMVRLLSVLTKANCSLADRQGLACGLVLSSSSAGCSTKGPSPNP